MVLILSGFTPYSAQSQANPHTGTHLDGGEQRGFPLSEVNFLSLEFLQCITGNMAKTQEQDRSPPPDELSIDNPVLIPAYCIPFVTCQVIIDTGLHILEGIQCGKHVDQFGHCEKVGLGYEVFSSLRMCKRFDLVSKSLRCSLNKSKQLLCFGHLWSKNLNGLLVDLHTITLLMSLDLSV